MEREIDDSWATIERLLIADRQPICEYYYHRIIDWCVSRDDRGEVSATTVVLAAALIALAISVGVVISGKVRDKANSLDLG